MGKHENPSEPSGPIHQAAAALSHLRGVLDLFQDETRVVNGLSLYEPEFLVELAERLETGAERVRRYLREVHATV